MRSFYKPLLWICSTYWAQNKISCRDLFHSLTVEPLPSASSSSQLSLSSFYYVFSNFQPGLEIDSEDTFHDFRDTNLTPFRRKYNAMVPTHGLLSFWFDSNLRLLYSNNAATLQLSKIWNIGEKSHNSWEIGENNSSIVFFWKKNLNCNSSYE